MQSETDPPVQNHKQVGLRYKTSLGSRKLIFCLSRSAPVWYSRPLHLLVPILFVHSVETEPDEGHSASSGRQLTVTM